MKKIIQVLNNIVPLSDQDCNSLNEIFLLSRVSLTALSLAKDSAYLQWPGYDAESSAMHRAFGETLLKRKLTKTL